MELKITIANSDKDRQACFRLRHIVFVEEQKVPVELELDEYDTSSAIHFLGCVDAKPVAASRIVVFGELAKIQRVVVLSQFRGRGLGRELMGAMMNHIRSKMSVEQMGLDAQTHAISFYESLGFVVHGEEFDDAGIAHRHMQQLV